MSKPVNQSRPWVLLTASLIGAGIFAFDAVTPRGIAVAMLYPIVVLVSLWSVDRRDSVILAAACAILSIVGYFISPHDLSQWAVVNRALALIAIGWTGVLTYRRKRKESALQESISALEDVLVRLVKAKRKPRMNDRSHVKQKPRRWVRLWRR
jgi:two-component system, LuxR family, sensor kinase FixL